MRLERIAVVYANWCPNCPPAIRAVERLGRRLHVHTERLDIDNDADYDEAIHLVENFGEDQGETFLVPQVFAIYEDGSILHVVTGRGFVRLKDDEVEKRIENELSAISSKRAS
jgi:hypothetical protein